MRAWVVPRSGDPGVFELREEPDPVSSPNQVVVRVRAIGLNFADCMARLGVYPNTPRCPFIPGMEVSGEVVAVGDGAAQFATGDRVVAVPVFGGHAELVAVPTTHVAPLPATLSWAEGAALAVTGLTADWALNIVGRARPKERVLVTAAAGGVGSMLVQMARTRGCRALAVASTANKRKLAIELGAEEATDYVGWPRVADSWGGLDVVLDSVGGRLTRKAWRRLDSDGRLVLFGFASAAGPKKIRWIHAVREWVAMGAVHPASLVSACRTIAGFNLSLVPGLVNELRSRWEGLVAMVEEGGLRPLIGGTWPFSRLPEAHQALQGRATVGKAVVLLD